MPSCDCVTHVNCWITYIVLHALLTPDQSCPFLKLNQSGRPLYLYAKSPKHDVISSQCLNIHHNYSQVVKSLCWRFVYMCTGKCYHWQGIQWLYNYRLRPKTVSPSPWLAWVWGQGTAGVESLSPCHPQLFLLFLLGEVHVPWEGGLSLHGTG